VPCANIAARGVNNMIDWLIQNISAYASHITWIDIVGYIASLFVAVTFYMKTIIPLRIFGICSNVFFILYGFFGGLVPVLVLHVFLLPLNIIRLFQMKKLIDKVKSASKGTYSMEGLVPYMRRRHMKQGEILFAKGSNADSLYYIQSGTIRLNEIDRIVNPGEIIGEIGIFSPFKTRTQTAECLTEGEVYTISESKITQLYFQNPTFGYYLIQLVIKRFIENFEKEQARLMGKQGSF
jgi:CRP/FNR family cyclic AMP-dependent transcriptional regulator